MRKLITLNAVIISLSLLLFASAQAASSVTFYHHDALGSVIATSDQNGLSLNEEYQPYGEKVYGTGDSFGGNEDWYTGKNYSEELDLTYFGSRWYDAKQGRFLSMDPAPVVFGSIHSVSRYHYANNNPYKFVDPDGENAVTALGGLLYETGQFVTGNGFDGSNLLGALKDGYNGEGGGFVDAAFDDATSFIPVGAAAGLAIKANRLLKVTKGVGNFADKAKLTGHFEKHGAEFGAKSADEYLSIAQGV